MRLPLSIGLAAVALPVLATDHNNLDYGRPLRFDDAYSIAFRERALEFGLSLDTFNRNSPTYGFKSEFKVGFAKNQDIGIAFDPRLETPGNNFDANNVEVSYFHGVRREIGDQPALAYRVDIGLPTGRGSSGLEARVRGIATKALGQYDRLHLNVDATFATDAKPDEHEISIGAVLGYSTPLGYPRRFDQTIVAEFGLQQSRARGEGYTGTVGLGLRRQVGVRSVFDVGLEADVFATRNAPKTAIRLAVGFSTGF